jgi:tetratricopeptide (TPR) repeat protein
MPSTILIGSICLIITSNIQLLTYLFVCIYSAAAYSQDNRHDMAVDDAQTALKINPQFARAYSRLGYVESIDKQRKYQINPFNILTVK